MNEKLKEEIMDEINDVFEVYFLIFGGLYLAGIILLIASIIINNLN